MDPALLELLKSSEYADEEEIEAIVRLDSPQSWVPGLRIISQFGLIATCRLRKDAIVQVREEEDVVSLKRSRVLTPEIEPDDEGGKESLPLTAVNSDIRRPPGLAPTGAGTVIGIVDWHCGFDHWNFRSADGSTRLLALWDQRGMSRNRYGYGKIYTQTQINHALQSRDPYYALGYRPSARGHGTHVMDIAAGNGRGGGPVGMAPEADLIFVHLANKGTRGLANLGDSVRILEAVDCIARIAGGRPWVINCSIGNHGGPHDGRTLIEMAFDYLLSAAPNRFICQSTGNYFNRSTHASGCLQNGEERTLNMIVDQADYTPNELEVWYSGKDEFAIRIESPTGTLSPWVGLGKDADLLENGRIVGRLYNRACDPNSKDNQMDCFLYPAAPPGTWRATLRAIRAVNGSFHAWLERDDACPECQTRFSEADADPFYTTGTIANSRLPLVIGAYNAHSPSRDIAPFSSCGPTRDGRCKPDAVAPGYRVLAARSSPAGWFTDPKRLVRLSGSSMASPFAAGCVALCLQAAGRPLWAHEIRALILDHTDPPPADHQSLLRYGRGYINIMKAVEATSKLSLAATASSISHLDGLGAQNLTEARMESYLDSNYFDLLDQVITEPASRAASEKNLLAQILRVNGLAFEPHDVDPDRLYRQLVFGGNTGRAQSIAGHFTVLARPGEAPMSPPREGDILLRVAFGRPGLGHVAVITDPALWQDNELSSAPFGAERKQPGYYALVGEGGANPHPSSKPILRRIFDRLRRMLPNQLLLRPNSQSSGEGDNHGLTYDQIIKRIQEELGLRFKSPDDPRLYQRRQRLRGLFESVPQVRTRELYARLGTKPTGDQLSALFHGRLHQATRQELLRILESRFPADTNPVPTPPAPIPNTVTCGRPDMGTLFPWERSLLALIHDKPESDFQGVAVLIGPIIIPGLMPWPVDAIVRTALDKGYAITIENNIWFPRALDTKTVKDLTWLVHESVHVVDYAAAGTEAFLKTYVQQAILNRFEHDDIPHEKRANRVEKATEKLLYRFPDLLNAIQSCDSTVIKDVLKRNQDAYKAALNEAMAEGESDVEIGEHLESQAETGSESTAWTEWDDPNVLRHLTYASESDTAEVVQSLSREIEKPGYKDCYSCGKRIAVYDELAGDDTNGRQLESLEGQSEFEIPDRSFSYTDENEPAEMEVENPFYEDMSLTALPETVSTPKSTSNLPFLLAGPIVRRATPQKVWFWFACSKAVKGCKPSIFPYYSSGQAFPSGEIPLNHASGDIRVVRLGENIWIVLVSAVPKYGDFFTDSVLGYDLNISTEENGVTKWTKLSDLKLDITYAPYSRPTFVIGKSNRRLVHGSCRRPGAPGEDASRIFDEVLSKNVVDAVNERPASIFLTGDQIYADDVATPLFKAVHKLAKDVFGFTEQMPTPSGQGLASVDSYPAYAKDKKSPSRQHLTHRTTSPIGFTTEDGECHLLSLPEYAAMYLAVWNPELCRRYGVDDGTDPNLRGFESAVRGFRRILANISTYMLCDDHEITDDWNLDQPWEDTTKRNPMARRIISNGLAAYWAFQAWGNEPDDFDLSFVDTIKKHLEELRSGGGKPGNSAQKFEETLLERHWSFMAASNPKALCVDTRTRRETPKGEKPILSGKRVWPFLEKLLKKHNFRQGDSLVLVLPTPLLPHRSLMYIQEREYKNWPDQRYEGDYELYGNNPRQRAELVYWLHQNFGPSSLVIFSGDVHHGSVVTGRYGFGPTLEKIKTGKADWVMRIVQITSSPIKNIKASAYLKKRWWTAWQTDAGNVGESLIPQFEYQYATLSKDKYIAMQAFVRKLKGDLGRQTYIFENHYCVVTMPVTHSGNVQIIFIGVKNSKLASAAITVDTDNDPSKFKIEKFHYPGIYGQAMKPIERPVGPEQFPEYELLDNQVSDEMRVP